MAYNDDPNYDPRYDEPGGDGSTPDPPGPSESPNYAQYVYAYTDQNGVNVFRGVDDGKLYRDDPNSVGNYTPYTLDAAPPPPPPPPPPGTNNGGGTLGGLLAPYQGTFTPPAPTGSGGPFHAPTYTPPAPFSYPDFKRPSAEDVLSEPGFQFRMGEGTKAIENSAAAKGVLRSGGTLKDLLKYGQQFASNEYGNVYNRDFGEWGAGFDKASKTYSTNYGVGLDAFDRQMAGALAEYNSGSHLDETNWNHAWDQYLQNFDVYKWNQTWPYTVLSDQQRIGLGANN